jgi:hypothetical protein
MAQLIQVAVAVVLDMGLQTILALTVVLVLLFFLFQHQVILGQQLVRQR